MNELDMNSFGGKVEPEPDMGGGGGEGALGRNETGEIGISTDNSIEKKWGGNW